MRLSNALEKCIIKMYTFIHEEKYVYITPEHILYALCKTDIVVEAINNSGGNVEELSEWIKNYLDKYIEKDG